MLNDRQVNTGKKGTIVQTSLKMEPIHFYFERKRDEEKEESSEVDLEGSSNEVSSQDLPEAENNFSDPMVTHFNVSWSWQGENRSI